MDPELNTSHETDVVATLIRAGGRREAPPEMAYRTVLAAAESALRAKVARRRRWRAGWALAAAAALAVLGVSLYQRAQPPASPVAAVPVAAIDRLAGQVETRNSADEPWIRADASRMLTRGNLLRTGTDSGAGLLMQRQLSLRIAADTEVELTGPAQVRLVRGAIYVDAAPGGVDRLAVATPLGIARHQGTQFEVRYEPPRLQLLVREGSVDLDRGSGPVHAAAGERVVVTGTGEVERTAISSHDDHWQWTHSLAPIPDFNERPATSVLEWVARQTGRELHYVSPAAEQRAASAVLHGHFSQLLPTEALDVTLATTELVVDLEETDRITVGTR